MAYEGQTRKWQGKYSVVWKIPRYFTGAGKTKERRGGKSKGSGADPVQIKKAQKALRQEMNANTFEKIARQWHANRLETGDHRLPTISFIDFKKTFFQK